MESPYEPTTIQIENSNQGEGTNDTNFSKKKIIAIIVMILYILITASAFGGVEMGTVLSKQTIDNVIVSLAQTNKNDSSDIPLPVLNTSSTMAGERKQTKIQLRAPFTGILAGPTGSGKTELLFKLINASAEICDNPPSEIIYCYGAKQQSFDRFTNVTFHEGMIDVQNDVPSDGTHRWLIVDDLMDEAGKTSNLLNTFTKYSHHKNISVWFVTQNLFHRNLRGITLNAHYIALFKNPRDKTAPIYLGRQIHPSKPLFLVEAYEHATEDPFSFLFLDMKQDTHNFARVLGNFLSEDPNRYLTAYEPK